MPSNSLIFFREFPGDIRPRSLTFRGLSAESRNFPWIIRGKLELSADYTAERHAFPLYNSQKVKSFRRLYRGKACFSEV
jgi:hypothetical protein